MAEEKSVKKSKSWRAGFLAGVASVGVVGGGAVGVNMNNEATAVRAAAQIAVVQQGNIAKAKLNAINGKNIALDSGSVYTMKVYRDDKVIGICEYKKTSATPEQGCWKFDAVKE
jgi:hypothetical protein